jgi:hypothetical protein
MSRSKPAALDPALEEATSRASSAWLEFSEWELQQDKPTIPLNILTLGNDLQVATAKQLGALKTLCAQQAALLGSDGATSPGTSPPQGGCGASSSSSPASPPALHTALQQCSQLMLQLAEREEELLDLRARYSQLELENINLIAGGARPRNAATKLLPDAGGG